MRWSLFILFVLMLLMLQVKGQYSNIMITNTGNPEEPGICIDPKNPAFLVAAANINMFFYSSDTGRTWTKGNLSSSYGVWGDPCVITDTSGAFYFFHLSNPLQGNWIDRIVCQKSVDHGVTWNNGSFTFLNGTKEQDKEWAVVDRRNNNIYVTWTQFDSYGSGLSSDSSLILFARSEDAGITWNTVRRISRQGGDCIDSDNTVEGAVPAVGPNGEVYVAWSGPAGIMFDRSTDMGETWLENDIFIADQPSGWDYNVPGIYRCNGLPVTACDTSNSPYRGTIYVNWTDQRNGEDDTDVWLSESTDGGNTWSQPVRVNDDNTATHQFFTWMTIDQTNGYLYFVFYDRRYYNDNNTDVFLAVSRDGGTSFENFCISESPFLPVSYVFFGDYNNITAYNDIVRPIWTRLDNTQLSIWTALVDMKQTPVESPFQHEVYEMNVFPNPAIEKVYYSFKLRRPEVVNLAVLDNMGRIVAEILTNNSMTTGKYIEYFNTAGLNPGIYYFRLTTSKNCKLKRFFVY